jgi:hypothetical protein
MSVSPPPDLRGTLEGKISVSTSVKGFERLHIPLTCQVVPAVRALPDTLFLGEATPGQKIQKQISLVSTDGTLFRIISVNTGVEHLKCAFSPEQGKKAKLTFSGELPDTPNPAGGSIAVNLVMADSSEPETIRIPIYLWSTDK